MAAQPIPNFFIAGAPKAGTTSLHHYLNQHPDIFMSPVKGPSYFSFESRPEHFAPELRANVERQIEATRTWLENGCDGQAVTGLVTRYEDYLKLFQRAQNEHAIGEGSVCYLWSKTAAKEIAAFSPSAKIVLILRHPAERAFSQYIQYLSDGNTSHSFAEHIAAALKSDGTLSPFYPFLDYGFYSQQLERMLDHIPERQVRVWLYEDTLTAPAKFFREVLTFLEVDPEFTLDTSRHQHEAEVPRALAISQVLRRRGVWRTLRNCTPNAMRPAVKRLIYRRRESIVMSSEDRRFLVRYYRDDVRRLERVIERDLSGWSC